MIESLSCVHTDSSASTVLGKPPAPCTIYLEPSAVVIERDVDQTTFRLPNTALISARADRLWRRPRLTIRYAIDSPEQDVDCVVLQFDHSRRRGAGEYAAEINARADDAMRFRRRFPVPGP
ncbi:MAG: hypothetical protein EA383_15445 [Spirochaetaceae bacterium]|nr:MAG: hypothetical protein EA383_15445 [Spirochaetaceae bacterium]